MKIEEGNGKGEDRRRMGNLVKLLQRCYQRAAGERSFFITEMMFGWNFACSKRMHRMLMRQGAAEGSLQRFSLSCSYAFDGVAQMAVSQPDSKTKGGETENIKDEHGLLRQGLPYL